MLEIVDLGYKYNGRPVVDGLCANLDQGRLISVVGPNGVGKTTLLKCVAGILRPSSGKVVIDGQDVTKMRRRQIAKRLGYVPQNIPPGFTMTVFDAVLAGRSPYIDWWPTEKDLEKTARVLTRLGLEQIAMQAMDRLSGGQVQKVLLARALVQGAPYLLLDEPTSNLDLRHQLEMLDAIAGLVRSKAVGVLMAMHDLNLAARFSDLVIMLLKGRIFCCGTPSEAITGKNIKAVYGIEARVGPQAGHLFIQPLRCCMPDERLQPD